MTTIVLPVRWDAGNEAPINCKWEKVKMKLHSERLIALLRFTTILKKITDELYIVLVYQTIEKHSSINMDVMAVPNYLISKVCSGGWYVTSDQAIIVWKTKFTRDGRKIVNLAVALENKLSAHIWQTFIKKQFPSKNVAIKTNVKKEFWD